MIGLPGQGVNPPARGRTIKNEETTIPNAKILAGFVTAIRKKPSLTPLPDGPMLFSTKGRWSRRRRGDLGDSRLKHLSTGVCRRR
jgi:hypothetical protein